jgi:hypothetical protein
VALRGVDVGERLGACGPVTLCGVNVGDHAVDVAKTGPLPGGNSCGHRLGVTLVGVDELHHGVEDHLNGERPPLRGA